MFSSHTISLFTEPPPSRNAPSAFAVSMVLHVAVIGITYQGLKHMPRLSPAEDDRMTIRLLDLHRPELQRPRLEQSGALPAASAALASAAEAGGMPGSMPYIPKQVRSTISAAQTLIQPDLPKNITMPQDFPIPAALLWTAANVHVARLSPPEKLNTTSTVSPSLRLPNQAPDLHAISMPDTSFASDKLALPPSTTSPIVVPGPQARKAPEMWSLSSGPPVSATVVSISDLQMQRGTIALPSINEVAGSGEDKPSPVRGSGSQRPGKGQSESQTHGAGPGKDEADGRDLGAHDGKASLANSGHSPASLGLNTGSIGGHSQTADGTAGTGLTGNGTADESAIARVELSKDGQFGVVVVGSSMAEQYPETLGFWDGRLAYTVYVHAGFPKNWILQYSLPLAADAAAAGESVRPEAPWPYSMTMPRSALSGLNADALLIRGVVNSAGRFEQLALVSPQVFPQQASMLSALHEWHFRPASQNGHATAVEVLLIIPELAE